MKTKLTLALLIAITLLKVNPLNAQLRMGDKLKKLTDDSEDLNLEKSLSTPEVNLPKKEKGILGLMKEVNVLEEEQKVLYDQMFEKHGSTFTEYDKAKQDFESVKVLGESSSTYQSAASKFESVQAKHAAIETDLDTAYYQKLEAINEKIKLQADKIAEEAQKSLAKEYDVKYSEYKEDRPEAEQIKLDYEVWSLIPAVEENWPEAQNLIDGNYLVYKLSLVYVDEVFNKTEEDSFLKKQQQEWEGIYADLVSNDATFEEVMSAQEDFMSKAFQTEEYQQIVSAKQAAKEEYNKQLKEVGGEAAMTVLLGLIAPDELKNASGSTSRDMLAKLKGEMKKAKKVNDMVGANVKGNSLIAGRASKSAIISASTSIAQNQQEKENEAILIKAQGAIYELKTDANNERQLVKVYSSDKRLAAQQGSSNARISQMEGSSNQRAVAMDVTANMRASMYAEDQVESN